MRSCQMLGGRLKITVVVAKEFVGPTNLGAVTPCERMQGNADLL